MKVGKSAGRTVSTVRVEHGPLMRAFCERRCRAVLGNVLVVVGDHKEGI
jgi:hypothetical protein